MAFFPSSVATQLQLLTPKNNTLVILAADCDIDDDVLSVDDASPLPDSGYLTFVDTDEIIYYGSKSGNTLESVTRGADGSAATTHVAGVDLEMRWNAAYHTVLADEIIAVTDNVRDRFGLDTNIVVPTGVTFTITDGLGIGGAVDSKAILSLTSTAKGFLPPRMTTVQRDAITSPTEGLVLYDTTTDRLNVRDASDWRAYLAAGAGDIVNADVNAAAAIAYSKLNLGSSIVNADVAAAAAIARSKLATGSTNRLVVNDGSTGALTDAAAITASRLLVSDANGIPTHTSVTTTEAGYLSGVTSAIQTQLTGKVNDTGDTITGDLIMDNQKGIKFREGSGGGTNHAYIIAPATLAGDYTLTLPPDDGDSGEVLSTNGSGVLDWVSTLTNPLSADLDFDGFGTTDLADINNTFIGVGRNRVINGEMLIDQANAGASVSVNSTTAKYGTDMFWGQGVGSAGVFSMVQNESGPAGASGNDRFRKSLLVQCTTADASLASTDRYRIATDIEGLMVRDTSIGTANARTVTLSFWVQGSLTGTYSGALQNSASDRSYPFEYTLNATDTWERKTVTIALDQSGTWLTDTGIGIRIIWALALGSNHVSTAGAWAAGNFSGTSNQVNFMSSSTTRYIYITGVQLEIGTAATLFERRPWQQEVALCQRYYEKSYAIDVAPATSGDGGRHFVSGSTDNNNDIYTTIRFAVPKRTTPTFTFYRTGGGSGQWDYNRSGGSGAVTAQTDGSSANANGTVVNIDNVGAAWVVALATGHWVADARF
jgi:hypothetical protein